MFRNYSNKVKGKQEKFGLFQDKIRITKQVIFKNTQIFFIWHVIEQETNSPKLLQTRSSEICTLLIRSNQPY